MKVRGDSGTDITQTIDDKVTIVGSNPNIFPSCRKDGAGRDKVSIETSKTQGVIEAKSTYTEYEAIDNSGDHHGGTYTIVAMNKMSIDAGNGGLSFNTGGNINLMAGGGLINIVGTECVNTISNVIKEVASEVIVLKGPEFYIDTENSLFVNSVKFAKNMVVTGGAFINGELFVNHITGPQQIMDTSMSPVLPVFWNNGITLTGMMTQTCLTPTVVEGQPVTGQSGQHYIQFTLDPLTTMKSLGRVLPHKHTYKHIACDFKQSNDEVWEDASATATNEVVSSKQTLNFGDLPAAILDKCKKRITNAFTDTISSLFENLF